jgi:hypothetical protein
MLLAAGFSGSSHCSCSLALLGASSGAEAALELPPELQRLGTTFAAAAHYHTVFQ